MRSKKVLAIDPGFDRMGVAVLEGSGEKPTLLYSICLRTRSKDDHDQRLYEIGKSLRSIIDQWQPEALAIETLFFNKNISSALGVAEARGVAIYEARQHNLKFFEYSPQAIKIAVTGYGNSDKLQVERMVTRLIGLKDSGGDKIDDELDAIAVGICHLATRR